MSNSSLLAIGSGWPCTDNTVHFRCCSILKNKNIFCLQRNLSAVCFEVSPDDLPSCIRWRMNQWNWFSSTNLYIYHWFSKNLITDGLVSWQLLAFSVFGSMSTGTSVFHVRTARLTALRCVNGDLWRSTFIWVHYVLFFRSQHRRQDIAVYSLVVETCYVHENNRIIKSIFPEISAALPCDYAIFGMLCQGHSRDKLFNFVMKEKRAIFVGSVSVRLGLSVAWLLAG